MMAWIFEKVAGGYKGRIGGIVWDGSAILFSVPEENSLFRFVSETGEIELVRKHTNHVAGLCIGADGRVFACQQGSRRVIQLHNDGAASQLSYRLNGKVHNHPSDIAVDRAGRVWFSDTYSDLLYPGPKIWPPLEHCSVLRQSRSPQLQSRIWSIQRMTFDTRHPSAIALSADESMLYVSENDIAEEGVRELRAYPIQDDHTLGQPLVLHRFGSDYRGHHQGIEGMCLDSNGNIIACAGWRRAGPGPFVMVISPSGGVLESWPVPDDMPTRCAFGHADLGTLYVGTGEGNIYRVTGTGRTGISMQRANSSSAQ